MRIAKCFRWITKRTIDSFCDRTTMHSHFICGNSYTLRTSKRNKSDSHWQHALASLQVPVRIKSIWASRQIPISHIPNSCPFVADIIRILALILCLHPIFFLSHPRFNHFWNATTIASHRLVPWKRFQIMEKADKQILRAQYIAVSPGDNKSERLPSIFLLHFSHLRGSTLHHNIQIPPYSLLGLHPCTNAITKPKEDLMFPKTFCVVYVSPYFPFPKAFVHPSPSWILIKFRILVVFVVFKLFKIRLIPSTTTWTTTERSNTSNICPLLLLTFIDTVAVK